MTNTTSTHTSVDDGFSGVSFEREGLQAMHEVEAGNVATVITEKPFPSGT